MIIKNKAKNSVIKITFSVCLILAGIICVYSYYQISTYDQQTKRSFDSTNSNIKSLVDDIKAKKEAKKKEPVYISLTGAKTIRAIVEDYTDPSSLWVLVSKNHAISTKYAPKGLNIPPVSTRTDKSSDERSVRSELNTPLKNMFNDASKNGISLMIGSGYRSAALQKIYFDSYAASVGQAIANNTIAYPGQSEHQTGLAVDITSMSLNCYLSECFESTTDGKWLADNSYKYGFVLRYPKGSEKITGYQYEPWHFRYVGIDLATALHQSKLTFDEAWPFLETALETLMANGAIE